MYKTWLKIERRIEKAKERERAREREMAIERERGEKNNDTDKDKPRKKYHKFYGIMQMTRIFLVFRRFIWSGFNGSMFDR